MSDLSKTLQNIHDLLAGKITFNQLEASEVQMFEENIASLDASVQPVAQALFDSFKAGASALVGAGLNGLGALANTSSDTQATMLLNLMQAAGIPTEGPLSNAERAALVTLITGLKTMLDRMGLVHLTRGSDAAAAKAA